MTNAGTVNEIYARAVKANKPESDVNVTVQECAYLQSKLNVQEKPMPQFCSNLLKAAEKRGILPRRNSRVAQTWKMGEHGVNRLRATEGVVGGTFDSVNPAKAQGTQDIYLASKSPAEQRKIKQLLIRTASKGARPRVDFDQWTGDPANQSAVHQEVRKELVRRQSRREVQRATVA